MFTDQRSVWTVKLILMFILIVWTAFSIIMNFSGIMLGSGSGLLNSFVSIIFFELWLAFSVLNGWTKSRGYLLLASIYFTAFSIIPALYLILREYIEMAGSITMFVFSLPILTPLDAMPIISIPYSGGIMLLLFTLLNFLAYFVFKAKSPMVSASS